MNEKAPKVIFLDIDGVLVNRKSLKERSGLRSVANTDCVAALNTITDITGAKLVISSAWRFCGLEEMKVVLKFWGVTAEVIGLTEDLAVGNIYADTRGLEIAEWLRHNSCSTFVILDDCPNVGPLNGNLVKTEFEIGLTDEHTRRAIALLGLKEPS